jgi:hypothetical protein
MGTPEILRCPEMEVSELELSLELGNRDLVFSPPPVKEKVMGPQAVPGPLSEQKKEERAVPAALSVKEK